LEYIAVNRMGFRDRKEYSDKAASVLTDWLGNSEAGATIHRTVKSRAFAAR
jgi:hypothetical protein